MKVRRCSIPVGIGLMLVILCAPASAQGGFQEGLALSLASEGGMFYKPTYAQEDRRVHPAVVDAFLLYDLSETSAIMGDVARFDTAHVVTAALGSALMVGGFATFIVAASGASDYRGTISIYFTSAGLFLGSAGAWLGNWFCQTKRVELRMQAIDLYNKHYGLETGS
ncbi:MAG: hypothetical protein JXM71_10890 [Spirochaetales bacterium]|nr:hypothetical protein [Spirochaetales bacterium]